MDLFTGFMTVAGITAVNIMKQKTKSLDDLETRVKQLLLEDRCSFSDEEKNLLNDCITIIEQAKKKDNLDLIVRIIEILSKLFIVGFDLSEIF